MPWRQVLKEHTQYEQSRKLSQRFDMFLIDASLAKLKATLFDSFQRKKLVNYFYYNNIRFSSDEK